MTTWQLIVLGIAGFSLSIVSGIAGAGAGFILTPLAIFFGLTPAQAVSTGKFNGLAVAVGSLSGMRKHHGRLSKRRVIPVMVLAFIVGLFVPFIIKTLETDTYRIAIGIIMLLMVPLVIYKQVGLHEHKPKRWQKIAGGGLLTVSLFLQGVFSSGAGTLVNLALMGMLGMSALEANMTKRWSHLILNVTVIAGVITSGLVIWRVAAVMMCCNFAGSYIGGKMAAKKGNVFIMRIMITLMIVSAILLIVGIN